MNRPDGVGFLANSLANLLVGVAAMGYAVIVPAMVLRRFGIADYSTWFLAFQIAAYVLLLDLGSQAVVTSEAANSTSDPAAARLTTAAMVSQLGLAVAVVAVATAWAGLTGQRQLARLVAILGLAALASLLASTVRAWFGGLQRSHVPALWLIGARLSALAGLGLALGTNADLMLLTLAVAVPQFLIHGGLLVWARRAPSPWTCPDRASFLRLFRRCSPLALWTVAGVLISGVDIFVVRAVDPSELGEYAISLPLLAIPTGIVTAAIAAWIARVARAEAFRPDVARVMTLDGTAVAAAALSMGSILFFSYADDLVSLWAGSGRWDSATAYLRILYLASCLRFVLLPWTVLIIVRGEQGLITFVPLTEAVVNLAASVALGLWLGASGVAIGTLAGAIVAAVLSVVWAVPRTARSGVTSSGLVRAASQAWPPFAAATCVAAISVAGAPAQARALLALLAIAVNVWWLLNHRRTISMMVA